MFEISGRSNTIAEKTRYNADFIAESFICNKIINREKCFKTVDSPVSFDLETSDDKKNLENNPFNKSWKVLRV